MSGKASKSPQGGGNGSVVAGHFLRKRSCPVDESSLKIPVPCLYNGYPE
jgi:hypothetical protein